MGHHAENVSLLIANAGDAVEGAVGVGGMLFLCGSFSGGGAVAEENLLVLFQGLQGGGVGVVAAFAMGNGEVDDLAGLVGLGPGEMGAFDFDGDAIANKVQVPIAGQRAGKQSHLGQHLKAIANAQNCFSLIRMVDRCLHGWRKARDRTAAQIIAIAKAARNHHHIQIVKVGRLMPDHARGLL